ncbi:MAG: hypothetical protein ABL940_01025 [Bacteroidia bacterium]
MKNNILTTAVGLVFLLTTTYNTKAQTYSNTQVAHVNDCIKRTMSLNVFITKDSIGRPCQSSSAYKLAVDSVQMAVDSLNAHLAPICLQFKVCKITFVDNYKFDWFYDDRQKGEREDFRNLYCEDSVINVLYVGLYFGDKSASNAANGGDGSDDFSFLTVAPVAPKKKKPLIVLGAEKDPRFLTKFLLKTMGMQATSSNGELVDGSNCELAGSGDRICDTPADPSGAQEGPPPATYPNCAYTGAGGIFPVDANGAVYAPMLGNILSDHGMPCTAWAPKALTAGQYNKIIKLYYGDQSNVITSWKRYK